MCYIILLYFKNLQVHVDAASTSVELGGSEDVSVADVNSSQSNGKLGKLTCI